eukprot:scpid87609/ scgid1865/ 
MDQSPIFQRIFLLLAALAYINAVHCAHWHKCPNGSYIVTLIESDKPTEIAAANKLRFNMECKANTMAIPRGSSCLRDFAVSYADTSTCYRSLFSGTAPPGDSSNIACPGLVGVGSRGDGKSPLICHFDWLSRNVLHWTDRRRPITVYLAKRSGGPRNATMTWAEASSACNASLLSASFMNVLPLVGAYVRYIADLLNQTRVWASTRHFSLDASSNFTRESRETAGTRLLPLCAEVDECSLAIHNCSTNGQCVNMLASYVCRCNPHFSGIYCTRHAMGESPPKHGASNAATIATAVSTSLLVLIGAVVALIVYKRRDLRMKSHKSSSQSQVQIIAHSDNDPKLAADRRVSAESSILITTK